MRYFVIGDDGQKYGPADVATLNGWIAEGRLLPTQQVEDEASGARMAASSVSGLVFPVQNTQQFAPGQPYQQHYMRPDAMYGDDGSKDLKNAWTLSIVGLVIFLCCPLVGLILTILGLNAANRSASKGNPNAQGAKLLSIIGIVVSALMLVGSIIYEIMTFATRLPH